MTDLPDNLLFDLPLTPEGGAAGGGSYCSLELLDGGSGSGSSHSSSQSSPEQSSGQEFSDGGSNGGGGRGGGGNTHIKQEYQQLLHDTSLLTQTLLNGGADGCSMMEIGNVPKKVTILLGKKVT